MRSNRKRRVPIYQSFCLQEKRIKKRGGKESLEAQASKKKSVAKGREKEGIWDGNKIRNKWRMLFPARNREKKKKGKE